jgi:hypothetical protein
MAPYRAARLEEEEVGAFDTVKRIPPSAEEEDGFGSAAPVADSMGMAPYRAALLAEEEVGAFDSVAGDMEPHGAAAWPDAYTSKAQSNGVDELKVRDPSGFRLVVAA